jgi:hypothetical protein
MQGHQNKREGQPQMAIFERLFPVQPELRQRFDYLCMRAALSGKPAKSAMRLAHWAGGQEQSKAFHAMWRRWFPELLNGFQSADDPVCNNFGN